MTRGDWNPERLREARASLHDHGRPISQERFAARVGISKRTLERYESLGAPKAPKAATLARIIEETARPLEFFFASDADDPTSAEAASFEVAIAQMFTRAVAAHVRPLQERLDELERQQAVEGWNRGASTRTHARRAA